MDKLITDFDHRLIIILSDSQKDMFEMEQYNQKSVLLEFFPRKSLYMKSNIFTFDYEHNVIEANAQLHFDGKNYNLNQLKVLDTQEIENLGWKRQEIMDLLGFEVVQTDDKSEKYGMYREFIDNNGFPPE